MRSLMVLGCSLLFASAVPAGEPLEKGTVRFTPVDDQSEVPEIYRLTPRSFDYEMELKRDLTQSGVQISRLRFPSPVTTPHPENNTVHAEYYRPHGPGPFPAVIVLDITGGDQTLSRTISTYLAQHGVAALFVQMSYYGPRRPADSDLRFLSPDVTRTLGNVRQTVLDLRCAAAWMAARKELDPKRLGIMGTSLGSFMAALTAEMEPRLGRAAVLLGGGGFVDAYYDDPRGATFRRVFEALGGTKEMLAKRIAPADPLTLAANLKHRKLLMLAARRDDIVPPSMAEALWNASGRQQIVWYDSTHYGAAVYLAAGLKQVVDHFKAD